MRKSHFLVVSILMTVTLIAPRQSLAQVQAGAPPHSVVVGGADKIDAANLNVHIDIPIRSKAGRQLPFTYGLGYNSSIWTPISSGGTTTWQPKTGWGWATQGTAATGYITYSSSADYCWGEGYYDYDPYLDGYDTYYSNFAYVDPGGASHSFNSVYAMQQYGGDSQCPDIDDPGGPATATDGSGYYLKTFDPVLGATIITPSGITLNLGVSVVDTNGNEISLGSSITDTLGTTALTVAGTGTSSSDLTYSYPAPSGAAAVYRAKYANKNILTNFACSGVSEYSASNVPLVYEIDLPDISLNTSDKYSFTYEATPGHSGYYTGRIASITFPTGGTINYYYPGDSGYGGSLSTTNNGVVCSDGSTAGFTRTTPDTISSSTYWDYVHSESGMAWTTTITDPQGNQTVMNFQGVLPTETQIYDGTTSSGTLLETVYTCYNGSSVPCNSIAVSEPISSQAIYTQWPGSGALESKIVTSYNTSGLVTEVDEYAYGPGSPGSLVRKTLTGYASLGYIVGRPSYVTVEDGSGAIQANTNYSYDGSGVTTTSGTPQHISVSSSRGNLTTVSRRVTASSYLNTTSTYYDTGNVYQATDVNSAVTTNNYSSASASCGNSFPTSVGEPVGSMSRSMTWNCYGGVETSLQDENTHTSYATYSTNAYYWVPDSTTDPLSNVTDYAFGPTSLEASLAVNSGSSVVDQLTTVDVLGRSHVSQSKEGPSSSTYDSVETDYDSLGRPDRTTLPYGTTTAGGTSSTAPGTSTTYDPLGRVTQVTDSGGLNLTIGYTQNDSLKTVGPAPTGENTKKKQYEYDALGRLVSVCEITSATGSGSCNQTSGQTGYWTEYTYDVNDNLTQVTQNAQASSTYQQNRYYTYDALRRVTSESNPESGMTFYTYDTDSTCGTSNGDLVKVSDQIGNLTCYAYDAFHRVTSMTYPSGSYASVTPSRYFVYDSATVNSVAMSNAKTRLAEAYTCTSCPGTKLTDVGFSYDASGKTTDTYQSTPHSGGYNHVSAAYWENGMIKQLSGLSGLPTITYGVDSKGRGNTVYASSGQNPVTATAYNVADEITGITFGSSDSDAFSFDANTDRMSQYGFSVNGTSATGTLSWNDNGTLGGLAVVDSLYTGGTQTCSFSHDDLIRIAGANCGSVWTQTFGFDAFGNINKSGSGSFGPSYSPTTNHMTSNGSCTPVYDSDGNSTNDCLHSFAWDSNALPVSLDSVNLTYNALGQMVEQNRSGTYTEIVYDPNGGKLALMNGSTLQKAYVQLPDGATAIYNSTGLAYYQHTDWLQSTRLASTPSRGVYFDGAYAPYGESYATTTSGTDAEAFTGMNQDTVSTVYDFPAREYEIQGRWPSPDPAGIAAADPAEPQSWNRYAYVRNNPLALVDPSGEDCSDMDWTSDASCSPDQLWSFCPWCGQWGGGGGGGGTGQTVLFTDGNGNAAICTDSSLVPFYAGELPGVDPDSVLEPCLLSGNNFSIGGSTDGGGGGVGAGSAPSKPTKPCNDANNNRSRFFQQLPGLTSVANQLNVPTNFIVGLSSFESGWFDNHNVALNNLWGLTQGGGNNIQFSSISAGNSYFVSRVGPFIQGAQTQAAFFKGLQAEGYNSVNPNYYPTLANRINNIQSWGQACGVSF